MQGRVLIADWSVAHFVVVMNDVMNENMAAFGQQTNQLSLDVALHEYCNFHA